jgi:CBS domain-containing protein
MKVPFWFASFFAKKTIRMKAREESIIYAIPIAVFRPFVANNAAVLNFLLETLQLISPVIDNENSRKSDFRHVFYTDQQSEMPDLTHTKKLLPLW